VAAAGQVGAIRILAVPYADSAGREGGDLDARTLIVAAAALAPTRRGVTDHRLSKHLLSSSRDSSWDKADALISWNLSSQFSTAAVSSTS
jgi:hypothetical protein